MKLINFTLFLFFYSCGISTDKNMNQYVVTKEVFSEILTDVQIAESHYQLNKVNNKNKALLNLKESYLHIYKKHQIDEDIFSESLSYYSERLSEFEEIHLIILERLNRERDQLN